MKTESRKTIPGSRQSMKTVFSPTPGFKEGTSHSCGFSAEVVNFIVRGALWRVVAHGRFSLSCKLRRSD